MMANHQSFPQNRIVIKDKQRDSTIWDLIKPRNTDIVICSCYKSGTTLTQQIVNLIVNGNDNFESLYDISTCLLYTSPSPRDPVSSRMPSSA